MKDTEKSDMAVPTRLFHSYCLGAAKTGTTSLAKAFSANYRAAHEPDLARTFNLIKCIRQGQTSGLPEALAQRDRELQLDMEASHPGIFLTPYLLELFPEARFVITIRNPRAWLSSRLDFHFRQHQQEVSSPFKRLKRRALYHLRPLKNGLLESLALRERGQGSWRDYNDMLKHDSKGPYHASDAFLKRYGVSSLDTYLREYSNHYRIAMTIPEDRRLMVNLKWLDHALPDIARFVGADPDKVQPSVENVNRGDTRPELIDHLPQGFVTNKLTLHCGWLVQAGLVEQDW